MITYDPAKIQSRHFTNTRQNQFDQERALALINMAHETQYRKAEKHSAILILHANTKIKTGKTSI
jgi:hypothetical protein